MGKITKVGGRGTSKRQVDSEEANWSGEKFKEYQKKVKEKAGDEYVSSGRGTGKRKLKDTPETTKTSTKGHYVSMGRGTGRRKLD
ncbi:hypothetical protein QVH35_02640 [Candidatus Nitrosotenuis chungbukensis]|uniref:hypothetical protein n=1 Tax=Candidatus Nitrosotenuis chungbukensis TaxID=1353246 RepID=UPI0005B2E543|nr:hypothetical protein [Candidatus Nitrosotenuis chungbukensis]WKT58362.1 hypothetical protein QVH35_02640 [Candidatus Nitrosotenuis chungbukensis]